MKELNILTLIYVFGTKKSKMKYKTSSNLAEENKYQTTGKNI